MMAIQQRLYAWVQRLLNVVSDSRTRRINRPSAVIGVETVDRLFLVGRARFDEGFPRGHGRDGRFGVRNDLNGSSSRYGHRSGSLPGVGRNMGRLRRWLAWSQR